MKKGLLYISVALLGVVGILFVWSEALLSAVPFFGSLFGAVNPPVVLALVVVVVALFVLIQVIDMKANETAEREGGTDFGLFREIEGLEEEELRELEKDNEWTQVGEDFDVALSKAVDASLDEKERKERREWVRDHLRETAAMRYAEVRGVSIEKAQQRISSGEWTDDIRASGFLSDKRGESVPLRVWLFDAVMGKSPFIEGVEAVLDRVEGFGEET